jgi:aconitate hydratase
MTQPQSLNSFGARSTLAVQGGAVTYYRLAALEDAGLARLDRLPASIKVLLEGLLRGEDGRSITRDHVTGLAAADPRQPSDREIPFLPARVLMQDFTGVPAVVDLAAMRSAMARLGGDPQKINPLIPADLVIDHSVTVDAFGSAGALAENTALEFGRNQERYAFLRWGQRAFRNFRVVPPASGICHQVNLEYLAEVVTRRTVDGTVVALPDTLVGTDSHTTMINGLGVLGWGVGGIEAEAALLGQPVYLLIPPVVGLELTGELPEGATGTDLVLLVTQLLRRHGVVGKFVEFFGPGVSTMPVPDRAILSNMAPEYGATMGFFPVDDQTLAYLRASGRPAATVDLVERYTKSQGLFRTDATPAPELEATLRLDLGTVEPSLAGPKRPQDRVALRDVKARFREALPVPPKERGFGVAAPDLGKRSTLRVGAAEHPVGHGAVAIAAITSCTNTSNPSVMLAAGLLARKAVAAGLKVSPWVKTSLAPGSPVVTGYLERAGLMPALEALGFHVVGYGCTTCIGNSGPLHEPLVPAVKDGIVLAAVLSGNRNFEGRIHPHVKAAYLASPPLVVAYALAGSVDVDLATEALGMGRDGQPVYLKDVWPSSSEVAALLHHALSPEAFQQAYAGIEHRNARWNAVPITESELFDWQESSTYIQHPPFFATMTLDVKPIRPIEGARVLALLGDSVTTDHISPAGNIPEGGPAGRFLQSVGVAPKDFNNFGARRGNDRVMVRGTFANIRLRNALVPGTEGGVTEHLGSGQVMSIFEAAERYQAEGVPTVILAGKDYGMGSSRDWAAKGTYLLGVRAVLAESYERIHRSNLVGMGVLPLQYLDGQTAASLGLTGRETYAVHVDDQVQPGQELKVDVQDGERTRTITVRCRIDTAIEVDYYRNGGILHTVLRSLIRA